ncbi:MAG TPA: ATP-dependent DNA helicase RecQ [Bacteroidales bacterium]|nr:ATP-dependent DNA helicase RecQ [Bacteroidales bacterium]HPT01153.1 ATP-dependent DNA helicase RecQ [Bacteroidales bacterium]
MSENPREILKKYWGYDAFRPMQEEIVASVLEGKDTLALLPTGGGKSVCFQVPVMCREGICIVVTPLVALMIDQVEHLRARNIPAVAVHSGLSRHEIDIAFDQCVQGNVKFLYVSPERLITRKFSEVARFLNVNLIAVDEAHCISQWGYDFRPPYLRIAEIRPYFPDAPVLALTATAVPVVVKDIQQKLLFKKPNVLQKSFSRPNLAYVVACNEDKFGKLLKVCSSLKGPGIVYVRNRRLTKEISEYLQANNISSTFYHAGLDTATRNRRQQAWMKEEQRVIVATNAFGMGIDKPNVRFVAHFDLPDTLEAYFQEAGRAGRDGKKSYAVLIYNQADILDARHMFEMAWPEPDLIRKVYQSVGNYFQVAVGSGRDMVFDFDLNDFSSTYKFKPLIVYSALKILEREGLISVDDAFENASRVIFLAGKEDLYRFQVEHEEFDKLIKIILRSFSGVFSGFVPLSEPDIARKLNLQTKDISDRLVKLHQLRILEYIPQRKGTQLVFTCERLAPDDIGFSNEIYFNRKKEARQRLEKVIRYISSPLACRSQALLEYFGEKNAPRCGICDTCIERVKAEISSEEYRKIETEILKVIRDGACNLKQVVSLVKGIKEEKILKVIRLMADNQVINADELGNYTLRD